MAEQITSDILAFIPDANPDWVYQQVLLQLATDPIPLHAQARILDSAFTHGYVKLEKHQQPVQHQHVAPAPPRIVSKSSTAGKRKALDENPGSNAHSPKKQATAARFDYTQLDRPQSVMNASYQDLSYRYLCAKLGKLPVTYIRHRFNQIGRLVPAYLTLHQEMTTGAAACELLRKKRHSIGPYGIPYDSSPLFTAERKALDAFIGSGGINTALLRSASPPPGHMASPVSAKAPAAGPSNLAKAVAGPSNAKKPVAPPRPVAPLRPVAHHRLPRQQPARPSQPLAHRRSPTPPIPVASNEMECGCCFGDINISEMVQCAEGHLFCPTCVKRHAETEVGDRKSDILCMDQSGCRAPFTDDQLRRVLSANTLDLLDRLRQSKELEAADLRGLEHCPFCDFACIIVDDAPTFLCQKPTCKIESCRKCRRKNHSPKTCEEMDYEENGGKGEHEVAEAMSRALIRDCPQCKTPFMKETGCNKMVCPKCGAISCYICRKEISKLSPYTHFNQQPDAYHLAPAQGRCRLWDIDRAGRTGGSPTRAHNEEVSRAEREARARLAAAIGNHPRIPPPQFNRA
ncbi:TRIAD3 [Ceratobasidium sp. AG-Ba]|nr:TRIAD3 [Ceratobasidium sp. AG-Ba]